MPWLNDFPRSCAVLPMADSFAGDSPAEVRDFIGCMGNVLM